MTSVPSVCLVVLDGWGLAPEGPGNAVALADTPVMDRIWAECPHTTLIACGESVGLPAGQMGNSEVGHLNLGAGAIVPQDLARIDRAVEDGTLGDSETLQRADGRRGARAPDRARLRRRRALLRPPPEGPDRAGRLQGRARRRRARLHGRPRHVAQGRREVPRGDRGGRRRAGRLGDRPLLRDGPRPALGSHPEGLRPARARQGRASRRQRRAGGQGRVRARRDRRVHRRHHGRRGGAHPRGRRRARLQLPARPHARDHARAGRGRLRRDRPRRTARWSSATRRSPSTTRTGTTPSCSRPSAPTSRSRR